MAGRTAAQKAPDSTTDEPQTTPDNANADEVQEPQGPPAVAQQAALKALDEQREAEEEAGKVLREHQDAVAGGSPEVGAATLSEEAAKVVEKGVSTVEVDGVEYVVGLDGVNPVSNENPDPRCVR